MSSHRGGRRAELRRQRAQERERARVTPGRVARAERLVLPRAAVEALTRLVDGLGMGRGPALAVVAKWHGLPVSLVDVGGALRGVSPRAAVWAASDLRPTSRPTKALAARDAEGCAS